MQTELRSGLFAKVFDMSEKKSKLKLEIMQKIFEKKYEKHHENTKFVLWSNEQSKSPS